MSRKQYERVILKISGDAFGPPDGKGINMDEVESIAKRIIEAHELGTEVAVVVGGGNIVRGAEFHSDLVTPATADYMGMLATTINALSLQDTIEHDGPPTRVMTALSMESVAEPFIRRRAIRHLEKDRIVILAAGTGNPHFTTDTAAALRATEIEAGAVFKATKVDGVYDKDPKSHPDARRYETISYMDVLSKDIRVMDSTAISMCMEFNLPIVVFNLKEQGNILRAIKGETIGTYIGPDVSSQSLDQ